MSIRRIFPLLKWVWQSWRWLILSVLFLCFSHVFSTRSVTELDIRIAGCLFQTYGFFVIVVEMHIFKVKNKFSAWGRLCSYLLNLPVINGRTVVARADAAKTSVSVGSVTVTTINNNEAIEERFLRLEKGLRALRENSEKDIHELKSRHNKDMEVVRNSLTALRSEIDSVDANLIQDKKREISNSEIGVFSYFVGMILTVFPVELSSMLSG